MDAPEALYPAPPYLHFCPSVSNRLFTSLYLPQNCVMAMLVSQPQWSGYSLEVGAPYVYAEWMGDLSRPPHAQTSTPPPRLPTLSITSWNNKARGWLKGSSASGVPINLSPAGELRSVNPISQLSKSRILKSKGWVSFHEGRGERKKEDREDPLG